MRDFSGLQEFVIDKVRLETTLDGKTVDKDTSIFDYLDSLGILMTMMDLEEEFFDPGTSVPEHVMAEFVRRKPSIEVFCWMVTDYALGNLPEDEIDENYVYKKMH